jgi:hypothetical protein
MMSHIHTLPEEVEIVLSELNASEINLENRSLKSVQIRSQEGWHAKYIPPYRAAYMGGKVNMSEAA